MPSRDRNTTAGVSMCSRAIRGCRPPGTDCTGTPWRALYQLSSLPPLVMAMAGDSRSRACIAAVSVSSVSPEYDSSMARVRSLAQPGR